MTNEQNLSPPERRYATLAGVTLLVITLFRLLYLKFLPLELVGDEAYYREWGRFPDWGFYSKPPLIGWINTVAHLAGIPGEIGVRWPAVIFGGFGLLGMFLLVRKMRGARAGFLAMLVMAACPGSVLLNALLTIDAPLLCFWSLAMLAFWTAISRRPEEKLSRAWPLYVVFSAFGVLAKQMMLIFPLLALIFLAASAAHRAWLRKPALWISLAIPMLALVPPLLWNSHHGWVTLHHTGSHVHPEFKGVGASLGWMGEFIGGQLGVVGPLAFILLVVLACRWLRGRETLSPEVLFGLIFSVPALAVFLLLSFTQRIQPNWPAAFYIGGSLATVVWLTDTGRPVWIRRTIVSGGVLAIGCYAMPFVLMVAHLENTKFDPGKRLRGWNELAQAVQGVRDAYPVDFIVMTGDRTYPAELSFYLADRPHVFHWKESPEAESQYDVWPGPLDSMKGRDALIIWDGSGEPPATLRNNFTSLREIGPITVPRAPEDRTRFRCFLATGLKAWAPARP